MELNKIPTIDKKKIRDLLAKHIIKELDKIDPLDILESFESTEEVSHEMNKLGGDVFTNKEIEKFDLDSLELIRMSIRNIKKIIRTETPLLIINSQTKAKALSSDGKPKDI